MSGVSWACHNNIHVRGLLTGQFRGQCRIILRMVRHKNRKNLYLLCRHRFNAFIVLATPSASPEFVHPLFVFTPRTSSFNTDSYISLSLSSLLQRKQIGRFIFCRSWCHLEYCKTNKGFNSSCLWIGVDLNPKSFNESEKLISTNRFIVKLCWLMRSTCIVPAPLDTSKGMEDHSKPNENLVDEEEEEYVLLDLDAVHGHITIPPNAPYVLSGLDTLNPILVIGDNLKLIGEYEETIGTCYVFTETDSAPLVHEETGPSEADLFRGKCIVDLNQASDKQVKPIASLHKILKFRLLSEVEAQTTTAKFK